MKVERILAAALALLGMCQVCIAADNPVAKPKRPTRIDIELTGIIAETTDQIHSRLMLNRIDGSKRWFIRAGYGAILTRTYSKDKVYTTELDISTLDAQFRRDRRRSYNFITAAANVRNQTPYSATYGDLSGYYMLSAGVGRKVAPGLDGEFALAAIHRYQEDGYTQVQPAYTLRLRTPVTDAMTLDGESYFVEPFSGDAIVDSRMNLTYKFTPTLSMRLTYVANNLLLPLASQAGWDKSIRISLVFSRSTP